MKNKSKKNVIQQVQRAAAQFSLHLLNRGMSAKKVLEVRNMKGFLMRQKFGVFARVSR